MKKRQTTKGRAAKIKGSRGERLWVEELRKTYENQSSKEKVKRVPMSGASWMKGDVVDLNDYDSLYEVKNCEQLTIPTWWKQAVREAGSDRTPILVVTQNFKPFYVFMEAEAMESLFTIAGEPIPDKVIHNSVTGLLEAVDGLKPTELISFTSKRATPLVELLVIPGSRYVELKTAINKTA